MRFTVYFFVCLLFFLASCSDDEATSSTLFLNLDSTKVTTPISDSIFYIDINPDIIIGLNDSITLDLDNDSLYDLKITYRSVIAGHRPSSGPYYHTYLETQSLDTSLELSILYFDLNNKPIFPFTGDTINNQYSWMNTERPLFSGPMIFGLWNSNPNEGYLLFRYSLLGDYRFGWMKINSNNSSRIVMIEKYAFSLKWNSFILAGQTN